MEASPDPAEPYQTWLDIPAEYCPPNHYVLLGVDDFSDDGSAIDDAAKSRTSYLHQIAAGPNRKIVQRLLGEVAVARRTLLNETAKAEYDQWLSTPEDAVAQPSESVEMVSVSITPEKPAVNSTKMTKTTKSASQAEPKPAVRRRRTSAWDSYKYHLLSASILAAAVGVFAFVNRDGGRRASAVPEVQSSKGSARQIPKPAPRRDSANSPSAPRAKTFGVDTERSNSGLSGPAGLDMAEFMKTGVVEGNTAKTSGITSNPTATKRKFPTKWWDGLEQLDVFNDEFDSFFEKVAGKEQPFEVQGGKVVVKRATQGQRFQSIVAASKKVGMGEGIAIDTTLLPKIDSDIVLGLMIGQRQVTLHATKQGISVRTQNQGTEPKPQFIENLRVGGKVTQSSLFLIRDQADAKAIHWALQAGGSGLHGTVFADLTTDAASFKIKLASTTKPLKKEVSISNLRFGKLKTVPTWLK